MTGCLEKVVPHQPDSGLVSQYVNVVVTEGAAAVNVSKPRTSATFHLY